jgi:hypothetical protein
MTMLALRVDASRAGVLSPLRRSPNAQARASKWIRPTSSEAARDARRPLERYSDVARREYRRSDGQKILNLAPTEKVLVDTFEKWPISLAAQAKLEFGMQATGPGREPIATGRFTSKLPNSERL